MFVYYKKKHCKQKDILSPHKTWKRLDLDIPAHIVTSLSLFFPKRSLM